MIYTVHAPNLPAPPSYALPPPPQVLAMQRDPQVYQRLTKSICPSVFGHDSIKQAVLLMLFGGVHKTTMEVRAGEERTGRT